MSGFYFGESGFGSASFGNEPSAPFPPAGPTTLTAPIPSYLYQEYSDDDDLQAFVAAYNAYMQGFVDWFIGINLPVYTLLSGALLDWVAQGLYGMARPTLTVGTNNTKAPYGTSSYGQLPYGAHKIAGTAQYIPVTDDIFKRIITWNFYKGDGQTFSVPWLKRRIHRFLNGVNGTDVTNDNTYDVGVSMAGAAFTITLKTTQPAQMLQYAISNGVLSLPFMYSFSVTLD